MAIEFLELELEDFGPYCGQQVMDLRTSESSPVVVVFGENTMGKTQLFSAIRWCLYGVLEPQQETHEVNRQLRRRLNNIARRDGATSFGVSIKFRNGDDVYHLSRRVEISGSALTVSADLRVGASVIPNQLISTEIGRILHPQISEFFLFDAELLERFYERLETERERSFIQENIERVLGIPALRLAQRDTAELVSSTLDQYTKMSKNQDSAKKNSELLARLNSELDGIDANLADLRNQRSDVEQSSRDIKSQLKFVEGLEADIREQESLEATLLEEERKVDSYRGEIRQLLSNGWLSIAATPIRRALMEIRDKNTKYHETEGLIQQARARIHLLRDQIEGGVCPSCKRDLPPASEETVKELSEHDSYLNGLLEDVGVQQLELELERRVAGLVDENSLKEIDRLQSEIDRIDYSQYERKRNIDLINDRLTGHSKADVRALGKRNEQLESAANSLNSALSKAEEDRKEKSAEISKLQRRLASHDGGDPKIEAEYNFFRLVDDLMLRTIAEYANHIRETVQANASKMFLDLVRDPSGYGGLTIAPDYRIQLLDRHEEPRSTSEGGKQLLALSLIAALKRAAVQTGPVVLDSPLGRLDLEHREKVLKIWIPYLGSQSIMLVQSGELTKAQASKHLGSLIGRAYEIVRPDKDPERAEIQETSLNV
jgi:DNA sulfur modification protein DndD